MKKTRFSEEQMVKILREADTAPVAERDLEIEVMKEVAAKMVGAPVRRRQVAYVHQRGLSLRRACALLSVARSTLRYSRGL